MSTPPHMDKKEQAYYSQMQADFKARPRDYEHTPPPEIRLSTKRWFEVFEAFVAAHPGAQVLAADVPQWRCLGMRVFTPDESATAYVALPLTAVRHEAPLSFRHHVLGDRFRRQAIAKRITAGERPSLKIEDDPFVGWAFSVNKGNAPNKSQEPAE